MVHLSARRSEQDSCEHLNSAVCKLVVEPSKMSACSRHDKEQEKKVATQERLNNCCLEVLAQASPRVARGLTRGRKHQQWQHEL